MGDKFTFGHGVEGGERYGVLIGTLSLKRTVVASYNNGWAPPHYLKYFLLNRSLAPAHIVVGLCLGNDLFSDIRETAILNKTEFDFRLPYREVRQDGELINRAPLQSDALEWLRTNKLFAERSNPVPQWEIRMISSVAAAGAMRSSL